MGASKDMLIYWQNIRLPGIPGYLTISPGDGGEIRKTRLLDLEAATGLNNSAGQGMVTGSC
eukprot:1318651-Amorphochlora_amoeboformis.AAC.1